MSWGDWGLIEAGARGDLPPLTMEPFDTDWSNGVMARHAHDGRPVGHLHWYTDGEIETIRVHPDFTRMGVGSAMLKHAQQNPHIFESEKPIHHSDQLSGAGRAWANSDPTYTDPGDEHIQPADEDTTKWGWTAVKDYVPAHIPYTGQNEKEMEKHLSTETQPQPYTGKAPYLKKTPGGYRTASGGHLWPRKHRGDHPPVPFDKRWSPNHPEHIPGPWETRTAVVLPFVRKASVPGYSIWTHGPRSSGQVWNVEHGETGRTVGQLWTEKSDEGDYVEHVMVDPEHRRKGLGRWLYEEAGQPLHNPRDQSLDGRAWAKSVGGPSRQYPVAQP